VPDIDRDKYQSVLSEQLSKQAINMMIKAKIINSVGAVDVDGESDGESDTPYCDRCSSEDFVCTHCGDESESVRIYGFAGGKSTVVDTSSVLIEEVIKYCTCDSWKCSYCTRPFVIDHKRVPTANELLRISPVVAIRKLTCVSCESVMCYNCYDAIRDKGFGFIGDNNDKEPEVAACVIRYLAEENPDLGFRYGEDYTVKGENDERTGYSTISDLLRDFPGLSLKGHCSVMEYCPESDFEWGRLLECSLCTHNPETRIFNSNELIELFKPSLLTSGTIEDQDIIEIKRLIINKLEKRRLESQSDGRHPKKRKMSYSEKIGNKITDYFTLATKQN